MSEDVVGTPGAHKHTLVIWAAIAVLLLLIAGAVTALALAPGSTDPGRPAAGSTPSPTPEVTVTPAPAAAPVRPGVLDEDDASAVLTVALAAPIATVGTSADLAELLKNIAVDAYAAELEAQWQELLSQGWSLSGAPEVVSTEVTRLDDESTPATAEVTACIDSSDVVMSDADGEPIGDASAQLPRARHLFTLVQGEDDIWRISAHSFPNDPKC